MRHQNRIRANRIEQWIVTFILIAVLIGYYLWDADAVKAHTWPTVIVMVIFITFTALHEIINVIYLTMEGIEKYRFGRKVQVVTWKEINQVCILRDFPISAKGSSSAHIVIIPVDCELFDPEEMSAYKYLKKNRLKVVKIDDNKKNRLIIQEHYGEIIDWRNN